MPYPAEHPGSASVSLKHRTLKFLQNTWIVIYRAGYGPHQLKMNRIAQVDQKNVLNRPWGQNNNLKLQLDVENMEVKLNAIAESYYLNQ